MIGIVFSILGIAGFAVIAYAITQEAKKGETDREDKWADYEHRKKH